MQIDAYATMLYVKLNNLFNMIYFFIEQIDKYFVLYKLQHIQIN